MALDGLSEHMNLWVDLINILLLALGGTLGFRALCQFRGGALAQVLYWFLAAGGVLAIHVVIHTAEHFWPLPGGGLPTRVSMTTLILVLILGTYKLSRLIPGGNRA
jgi:hypothetical protein